MTREEVFDAWARGWWADWVKPVLFAQMPAGWVQEGVTGPAAALDVSWLAVDPRETAVVVDLPGDAGVHVGMALAERGFRPVPVYNGFPYGACATLDEAALPKTGSGACLNVWPIAAALWRGADTLAGLGLAAEALPCFLLDSRRRLGERLPGPGVIDNRWVSFPTDFPSARLLRERGIRRVVVYVEGMRAPAEDLAQTLLRWQEGGIELLLAREELGLAPVPFKVKRPGWFRMAWRPLLVAMGLKRRPLGGFWGMFAGGSSGGG